MRYIEADKLKADIKEIARKQDGKLTEFEVLGIMSAQPTADVRENVKGRWIADELTGWLCSNCGEHIVLNVKMHGDYCPNCGADMRGESWTI